ncbi:MAG: hypothetical protein ACREIW_06065 [Chthoniobacterales bacterium]
MKSASNAAPFGKIDMSLSPFFSAKRNEVTFNALANSRLPWPFAAAYVFYFFIIYRAVVSVIPIFIALFKGLDVALPMPTRFLFESYRWLFPLLFVGSVSLIIAIRFVPLTKTRLRLANLTLILAGAVSVAVVALVLYLPYLDLIWKLHRAK